MNKKQENELNKKDIEKMIQICREHQYSDPEKCLLNGKVILEIARKNNDLDKEALALQIIGKSYFNLKDYDESIKWLKKIIARKKDFSAFRSYASAHQIIGHSYWRKRNFEQALKFFEKSLEIREQNNDKTETARDCLNLGGLLSDLGNYTKSIEFNNKAYNIFKTLKDERGIGFATGNLGGCYYNLGEFEKGLNYQLKAVSYAKKIKDLALLGRSLNSAALLYQKLGNYKKAVESSLESLKIKEKLNDNLTSAYTNLGIIYKEWNNFDKAREYYNKALKISETEKDKPSISRILNNIGNMLLEQNKDDLALSYFKKSLILKKELDDKQGMMVVLSNIGIIYEETLKDFEKAEKYYNESLILAEELNKKENIISISLGLAKVCINKKEFEKAEKFMEKCNEYLKKEKSYDLETEYHRIYSQLFKKKKNYKKALDYFDSYTKLKDKVFNEENQRAIAEMQTKYETEKKERESEIYRLKSIELAEKNKQIKKQNEELERTIEELNRSDIKYHIIAEELNKNIGFELIGESENIKKIVELIKVVGQTASTNILITGESGTGKEIVARQIHQCSSRKDNSFYAVNSSAIPDALFESQFFGHEKNAFTGANKTHIGWFEIANGGTLFLDEIGTMSIDQQVKLLRVLEERKIIRLGSHKEIPVDVRIISATNVNLFEIVKTKKIRDDLYHRLSTFVIQIPPLRKRKEDIPLLLEHFVTIFSTLMNKKIKKIEKNITSALIKYDFPGNVRELKNIVERAVIISDSSTLKLKHFIIPQIMNKTVINSDIIPIHEMEKNLVLRALKSTGFNKNRAAKLLGVERRVVSRKMIKYGIENEKK